MFMQEQIEIFPNGAEVKPAATENQRVMAAVESVAPKALRMVAGNAEDEQRVQDLVGGIHEAISRGGKVSAMRYVAQVGVAA
jgi:hypothetical protein